MRDIKEKLSYIALDYNNINKWKHHTINNNNTKVLKLSIEVKYYGKCKDKIFLFLFCLICLLFCLSIHRDDLAAIAEIFACF